MSLLLFTATACGVELKIPATAQITCITNSDCPNDYRCTEGRCLSLATNLPPQVVVGTPERALDLVSLPITVTDFEGDTVTFTGIYVTAGVAQPATLDPLIVQATSRGEDAVLTWHAVDSHDL